MPLEKVKFMFDGDFKKAIKILSLSKNVSVVTCKIISFYSLLLHTTPRKSIHRWAIMIGKWKRKSSRDDQKRDIYYYKSWCVSENNYVKNLCAEHFSHFFTLFSCPSFIKLPQLISSSSSLLPAAHSIFKHFDAWAHSIYRIVVVSLSRNDKLCVSAQTKKYHKMREKLMRLNW